MWRFSFADRTRFEKLPFDPELLIQNYEHFLLDSSYGIILMCYGDKYWGGYELPLDFYGSEKQINYFVMQNGCGHLYFVSNTNE